jgi:chromosome segregation ATPase
MLMARKTNDDEELDERLADAQAQIESLQAAAADAEARAATLSEELTSTREARASLKADLAEAAAAREAVDGELSQARSEVEGMRSQLAEASVKYREAKLAAAPGIPQDLVPAAASLAEIDESFEAAKRIAGELRERMLEERQAARVPVGSPARRPQDLSALSASEKIKLGLRELSER